MVSTQLKNMLVKLDHFPRDRGENKTYLKLPPRHHAIWVADKIWYIVSLGGFYSIICDGFDTSQVVDAL